MKSLKIGESTSDGQLEILSKLFTTSYWPCRTLPIWLRFLAPDGHLKRDCCDSPNTITLA